MTLATAEMQFSVALAFSLALESGDWITPTRRGTASEEQHNENEQNMMEGTMMSMKQKNTNSQNPLIIQNITQCHGIWQILENKN